MKYVFTLVIGLIQFLDLFSQSISGKVASAGEPVSLANVLLLKKKDSTLITAAISNDKGNYTFNNIKSGSYLIKTSRVGFREHLSGEVLIASGNKITEQPLVNLIPVTNELKEITVTGKRPFIEQRIDRMIVNVANSIIASGSTVLEVLEKSPGIAIDQQNDLINFKGKEGVIILIDGRQTYLAMPDLVAMLRNMPSDNIDRIELITNPSAKYDAAGNSGIIDIRLKKNNNIGTNGVISLSAGSGKYGRKRGSLQLNHRTSHINIFGNYSTNKDGNYWNFDMFRNQADGTERNLVEQLSYIRFWNSGHNAKAGVDIFLDKKTTAGVVWTGNWSRVREHSPAQSTFRRSLTSDPYLQTLTDKSILNKQSNQLMNLNLVHHYSNKGQISADIDLGRFTRTFSNLLNTNTVIPAPTSDELVTLLSYMPTNIDLYTFKTDYSRTLRKGWKMETGLKASTVNADNDMELSQGIDGNVEKDSVLSNHFTYKEQVYAAFLSFSGSINEKTELLFGLRAEQTHSIANSITTKNVTEKNYLNLFPSAFITRTINKNNSLTFSYSYRIDRPNYQFLNPSRSYLDPFAYSSGNPFLTPQYSHSLELKHGYKAKLFTSVGATFVKDMMLFVVQPIDGKSTRRMPENIGSSQSYNTTVSFPVTIMKGWSMQNSLMGIYSTFSYVYLSQHVKVKQISGRFNMSNSFVFGNGWTGEVTGRLNTPSINAINRSPWLGAMDMGLQKSLKKRWKFKASLQDVFHTGHFIGRINTVDYQNKLKLSFDSRIFMMNVTYALGNEQLKNSRQRKMASEEEQQRAN